MDCRGFRELCIEAGLADILLYVGKLDWEDVEARYLDMGFDRAFPNQTRVEGVIEALDKDFARRPKAKP